MNEQELREENNNLREKIKRVERKNRKLEKLSQIDFLTNLYNRRAFSQFFGKACEQVRIDVDRRIQKSRFCLALFDIDNFKVFNNEFGHPFGDKILKSVALFIRESVRDIDMVARLGGDEFAILLKNTDLNQSQKIIESIFEKIENKFSVRFSVGIIQSNQKYSPKEVFKKADDALLKAKKQGKNQIVIS